MTTAREIGIAAHSNASGNLRVPFSVFHVEAGGLPDRRPASRFHSASLRHVCKYRGERCWPVQRSRAKWRVIKIEKLELQLKLPGGELQIDKLGRSRGGSEWPQSRIALV
jgi:hypothetical protein